MMLQPGGGPGLLGNSGEAGAATAEVGGGSGGSDGGGFMEEEKESEPISGGNRWPRQETIALLKIRSDMDVAFRDSSLKGPLWEDVSRKLSELGYRRSAKKCKEKFENVFKYHKRTKDGRTTKPEGKTYRFFEHLQALDTHPSTLSLSSPMTTTTTTMLASNSHNISPVPVAVSSTQNPTTTTSHVFQNNNVSPIPNQIFSSQPTVNINPSDPSQGIAGMPSYNNISLSSYSTSSSTSSDEQPERHPKKKRKWKEFFGRLMTEVIQKQDELQKKFMDALEKRERDRMAREEARRVQEMAKMNREHELLAQERSAAAAKDAALISYLQKIAEQQNHNPLNPIVFPPLPQHIFQQNQLPIVPPPPPPQPLAPVSVSTPQPFPVPIVSTTLTPTPAPATDNAMDIVQSNNNGGENIFLSPSPSRWPKAEVLALIKLRTTLDTKYHENGPKGPLWEEVSSAMRKLGYNRNAKRCKEKWENINKYYKKVKESNKKRPEDAKTCPYFHQLEALYKEKAKSDANTNAFNTMAPLMVEPEQQWPLPHDQQQQHQQQQHQQQQQQQQEDTAMEDDDTDEYEDGDDKDDDDDDDGAGYEVVTNKGSQERE